MSLLLSMLHFLLTTWDTSWVFFVCLKYIFTYFVIKSDQIYILNGWHSTQESEGEEGPEPMVIPPCSPGGNTGGSQEEIRQGLALSWNEWRQAPRASGHTNHRAYLFVQVMELGRTTGKSPGILLPSGRPSHFTYFWKISDCRSLKRHCISST